MVVLSLPLFIPDLIRLGDMSPKSCDGWYGGWVPQGMALGHLLGGMGGVAD